MSSLLGCGSVHRGGGGGVATGAAGCKQVVWVCVCVRVLCVLTHALVLYSHALRVTEKPYKL